MRDARNEYHCWKSTMTSRRVRARTRRVVTDKYTYIFIFIFTIGRRHTCHTGIRDCPASLTHRNHYLVNMYDE